MAEINVKQLSKAIKIDLDNLLAQMKAAGLSHKSEKDVVSTEDKKPDSYTHLTLPTIYSV